MMIMMLQDSIIYRLGKQIYLLLLINQISLVWHARMELEEHYKVLGVHVELQQEVFLDDLPNNQILELCLQMRKKGSLIEDWSACSEKTTLRTRVTVPTEKPPDVEVTLPSPIANDLPKRERMMILIATVVFIVSVVGGSIIVKNNWRTIK